MHPVIRTALGAAILVLTAVVPAEAQDESGCISALYKAAGKHHGCVTKAFAAAEAPLLLRCRQKYAASWAKLGTKYPGSSCDQARFTDNGTTITDNLTRLVWEKKTTAPDSGANPADPHDVDNIYSISGTFPNTDGTAFTEFLDDLNGSGFAGQRDWRLPTIVELDTIVSTDSYPCASAPCIVDPVFASTRSHMYWSSKTFQGHPSETWYVYFYNGNTYHDNNTLHRWVRAVRAGL